MKVVKKPIECSTWYTPEGILTPIKFKYVNDEKRNIAIKVNNIFQRDENKLAGNRMMVFKCQSTINGQLKEYELTYEVSTCKWTLMKM